MAAVRSIGLAARAAAFAIALAAGLLVPSAVARAANEPWPVPAWAASAFEEAGIEAFFSTDARYIVTFHVNPMVAFGDFDGDHLTDVAVLIRDPKTGKVGIAITRQAGGVDAPPTLAGDALYVEKSESASAIVYFTGKAFAWYQQGD